MRQGKYSRNNSPEQTGGTDVQKRKKMILQPGSMVIKIYRREIFLENGIRFPEHIFYEDNALGNSYFILAKHFEYIEEPLYYYYQHESSTVHTISKKRCEDRMEAGRVMLAEAERHDFLDRYRPELEYSFTLLFYVNTLFTYMAGVRWTSFRFVKELGQELKWRFPDFQNNSYYCERTHEEEKKLIRMQMKSTLLFVGYYKLLWTYRNMRKRWSKRRE